MFNRLFRIFKKRHKIQLHICKLNHVECLVQVYDMKTSRIRQSYLFKSFHNKSNWWSDREKYSMPNFITRMTKYEN